MSYLKGYIQQNNIQIDSESLAPDRHIKYLHGVNLLVSLSILKFSRMEPLSIPSTFLKKGRICLVAITEREEDLGHTTPETNQRPWRRISLKRLNL
jgi:hypothetical protein